MGDESLAKIEMNVVNPIPLNLQLGDAFYSPFLVSHWGCSQVWDVGVATRYYVPGKNICKYASANLICCGCGGIFWEEMKQLFRVLDTDGEGELSVQAVATFRCFFLALGGWK